jgi:UDP-4-amino-4,6-dideoxy-N-acetyl-beta-L-altrosamine transaminase
MIPYGRQYLDDDDVRAVVEALKSDWLTQGPRIDAFEEAVASYCGARWGVAFSSGTAALHAACACLDLSPGDEVVTSPITFLASANAPYHCGAKPVFADVEEDTVNLSPASLEAVVTPRTRAVIPVHFAGHCCDMDAIQDVARRHSLTVVADAAHALGAEYRGRKVGELSEMAVLSFHPVKHITTGEGGMVLGECPDLRKRLQSFRHHAIVRDPSRLQRDEGAWYYEMRAPGFNYRITDVQCALGLSQLEKADRFIARRRELAALYDSLLAESDLVRTPAVREDCRAVYHIYVARLNPERLSISRREVFEKMREAGIGCQIHYIPVHLQPFFASHLGTAPGDCPEAERYYEQCLTLPLFYTLKDDEVRFVSRTLLEILEAGRR